MAQPTKSSIEAVRRTALRKHLARIVPDNLKPALRRLYYFPLDLMDRLSGRAGGMIPPRSMSFDGVGDFKGIGREFRGYFVELGGLRPGERVLDVGCGIGRMAVPLTDYLSKEGGYWGFDIVKQGVDWCQSRISPRFANFHFLHSDIYNKHYNAGGKVQARDYRFPFEDRFFDFAFLTSVFTHMLPADLECYLAELARVLKPGGRALITFFLLNDESRALLGAGRSRLDFRYRPAGPCLAISKDDPEMAIAYYEGCVRELFQRHAFALEPIRYGSWCERETFLSHQDIVIAVKG